MRPRGASAMEPFWANTLDFLSRIRESDGAKELAHSNFVSTATTTLTQRSVTLYVETSEYNFACSSEFSYHKVLRLSLSEVRNDDRRERINAVPAFRATVEVKGGALIHGARLVACPVRSEWRTRRPSDGLPTNWKFEGKK